MNSKKLPVVVLGVSLACIATYLNVNGIDSPWLWFGVFICTVATLATLD